MIYEENKFLNVSAERILKQQIMEMYASRHQTERELAKTFDVPLDYVREVVCKKFYYGIRKIERSEENENSN